MIHVKMFLWFDKVTIDKFRQQNPKVDLYHMTFPHSNDWTVFIVKNKNSLEIKKKKINNIEIERFYRSFF